MNSQHIAFTMHLMFAAHASVNPAVKAWLNFFFPLAPQEAPSDEASTGVQ